MNTPDGTKNETEAGYNRKPVLEALEDSNMAQMTSPVCSHHNETDELFRKKEGFSHRTSREARERHPKQTFNGCLTQSVSTFQREINSEKGE